MHRVPDDWFDDKSETTHTANSIGQWTRSESSHWCQNCTFEPLTVIYLHELYGKAKYTTSRKKRARIINPVGIDLITLYFLKELALLALYLLVVSHTYPPPCPMIASSLTYTWHETRVSFYFRNELCHCTVLYYIYYDCY